MSLLVRNHQLIFRPLRGGIAIMNGNARIFGTLGCLATSDGADRWIVSAHHVLRGLAAEIPDDEPIFQPAVGDPSLLVARTAGDRADRRLDVAAARVLAGVETADEVLGIGPLGPVAEPEAGMRVVKSGIGTGITEGVVARAGATEVEIVESDGFPSKYELAVISDSGSVWIEPASRSPIALHVGQRDLGRETAIAVRLSEALRVLGLRLP